MTEDARPLVLVIATGKRDYREYLLRSIATEYRVHLLLDHEPGWEQEYIVGSSTVDLTDTIGAGGLIEAARKVPGVAGVLTWDEARVLQAAKVAQDLGLPGGDPDAVLRCRDKHLTRVALDQAGVPQAKSILVSGVDEALAAAESIGYPVVLKPRAMAASLGVVRVDDPDQLRAQFGFARDTTVPGAWTYETVVLVEELLTGAEISVDAAVHDGRVFPMFVARKEVGYAPYFEEVGHVVAADDPLLRDAELLDMVQRVHTALGYGDGMTHSEFKLTPAGPRLVEVNARLGGDLIPYLGMRASGADPGLAAAAVACGVRPAITTDRSLVGAVRFFYVDEDDTQLASVTFEHVPSGVDKAVAIAEPGSVVSPPPKGSTFGRIAFATAIAESAESCLAALDSAQEALRVRTAVGV
ncbi:ATP-grasp domain-containing protein [Labedaea rhizosphaerae]|uniref:Biotin carboxylase n=1 Tax=Labedaea rhizosphaerae TaxID=598644 RepID=A0A4R6S4B2_LABRH|nr:ATP-grasp domain-containing protein [Labedaea rhizosphaerae]TDP94074.1 biotin carboxylase [Labedaea rhizosphaerae]